MAVTFGLQAGDMIEIRYRVRRPAAGGDEEFDRWIAAEIIECEPDSWPLARLADGQLTDVRPFMDWRAAGGGRSHAAA